MMRSTNTVTDILRRRADRAPGARRVLTRDEAIALADSVLKMSKQPLPAMHVEHRVLTIVRITKNTRVACVESDRLVLRFPIHIGSDIAVLVDTNVRDAATLQRVVQHAEARATPPLRPEDQEEGIDPADPPKPRTYLPVSLWHDATQHAMDALSGDAVGRMVAPMQSSGLTCAGTIVLMTRVVMHRYNTGTTAWGEDTDSEITVSARSADGKSSGWMGQAHRDWSLMRPDRVVRDAIEMARRSRNPVRVEPGRYTTVLGPAAVGALVAKMGDLFNGGADGPFALRQPSGGHVTKLGQRVFDPRITMLTDPTDPECGEFPFYEEDGFPSGKATWVENGVLRQLAYDPGTALALGKVPIKDPRAIRMHGGTSSIPDMIAKCERGIYVHRLSGVELGDSSSGSMLGTTRDGCFLIKNGKIQTPVTNLRFYQSPFLSFNRLLDIGQPERVAFGFTPPDPRFQSDPWDTWPQPPVIVPPMMVEDFNFSAMTDAI